MIGWHLLISAILTSAAVAGCITYLLRPPMAFEVNQQPHVTRLSLSDPDAAISKAAAKHPIENEKAAIAYLEVAQEILRRAPLAQASASTDQLIFTARVPLPRKRPIPR
jgi:cytochrome c-type biogenesis protein CcmH/NrfG